MNFDATRNQTAAGGYSISSHQLKPPRRALAGNYRTATRAPCAAKNRNQHETLNGHLAVIYGYTTGAFSIGSPPSYSSAALSSGCWKLLAPTLRGALPLRSIAHCTPGRCSQSRHDPRPFLTSLTVCTLSLASNQVVSHEANPSFSGPCAAWFGSLHTR